MILRTILFPSLRNAKGGEHQREKVESSANKTWEKERIVVHPGKWNEDSRSDTANRTVMVTNLFCCVLYARMRKNLASSRATENAAPRYANPNVRFLPAGSAQRMS